MLLTQLERVPAFRILFFCEAGVEGVAAAPGAGPQVPKCLAGRIALDAVWDNVPDVGEMAFYLAGPPVMQSALAEQLAARGIAPDQIRTDAWE